MKLSQLSTDEACDVLAEITPYITDIMSDEALLTELKNTIGGKELSTAEVFAFGANKISKIINILLKQNKKAVYGIIAALNKKSPDEIANQNFITTGKQIREIVKDRELWDFFTSFARTEENP